MSAEGPAGPHRTGLARGVSAHRDHEVDGLPLREFVPALAAQAAGGVPVAFEAGERLRVNAARGPAPGAAGPQPAGGPVAQEHLGQDASRRVPGAEEEDLRPVVVHGREASAPEAGRRGPQLRGVV